MPEMQVPCPARAVIAMQIEENLAKIKVNIANACSIAGRQADQVKILAATKGRSIGQIQAAMSAGITLFGENYLQEAEKKISTLPNAEWHFIGHLQSNKAKKAVELFSCIQSVDSLKLASRIDAETENPFPVFIEVNIAEEKSKFGVKPAELTSFHNSLTEFRNLELRGLMCMAPFVEAEQTRGFFQKMKQLAEQLSLSELSMGMSNDYQIAVEENATIIRLGNAIFG